MPAPITAKLRFRRPDARSTWAGSMAGTVMAVSRTGAVAGAKSAGEIGPAPLRHSVDWQGTRNT